MACDPRHLGPALASVGVPPAQIEAGAHLLRRETRPAAAPQLNGLDHAPDIAWIKNRLRWGTPRVRHPIRAAYFVGSRARNDKSPKPDSDLDIALVIPRIRGKTALQFSDEFHQKQRTLPEWDGVRVDFQFFYADDPELAGYSKIEVAE